MKIAIITDQHLDGRKGSLAFWNYFQKFYDEIFFPTLEKEGIKVVFDPVSYTHLTLPTILLV